MSEIINKSEFNRKSKTYSEIENNIKPKPKRPKTEEIFDELMKNDSKRVNDVNEEMITGIGFNCLQLDNYFLENLFSFLNVKQKLSIERVCKRWQSIIREMLLKQTGLGTTWTADQDWNCLDSNRDHSVNGGDIREAIVMSNGWFYDLTHQKSIQNLEYISIKCPNIKSFHVSHCIIDSNCFQKLMDFFPDIECIHLKSNILKSMVDEKDFKASGLEWHKIGKVLGQHIYHLSLDPHYEHRMNENDAKQLIQHFKIVKEFRVGTHFDREVEGKFVSYLTNNCKLFYSIGREFPMSALNSLKFNQSESLTHLTYFSNVLKTFEAVTEIGKTFANLVRLKINLSYNEFILTKPSPFSKLTNLQELSLDLNSFSDNHVDDGLIWCIKDDLPTVKVLEISRASISVRAFNSIQYCLPSLNRLIFKCVEIKCNCESGEILDRSERYRCSNCRKKCWKSISQLKNLKALELSTAFFRSGKLKPFHNELCEVLPEFKNLRNLTIFRYDISSTTLFGALKELMSEIDSCSGDIFVLKLKSIPIESNNLKTLSNVCVIRDNFML